MRTIPYGYRMKNGNIVVEQNEAKIVKYIFDEYIGGLSYIKLADKLNAENIIYSNGCEIWKLGTVKKLIAREHYIGKNGYPRIISDEEYYTAQRLSKERRRAIGGPTLDLAEIKKITICGECGHRLERFGNKYKGVRCEACNSEEAASEAKAHNNINIIALPADEIDVSTAVATIRAWLGTEFLNGRYLDRLNMIKDIETKNMK